MSTRDDQLAAHRSLAPDLINFEGALAAFPGAVIVIANDWPFFYDLETIRRAGEGFGRRFLNVVNTFGGSKEDAVLDFMMFRTNPFVVVASSEFEFSSLTASRRVDLDHRRGFDEVARQALETQLRALDEHATRQLSDEEMLEASSSRQAIRRARRFVMLMRADEDLQFQRSLRSLVGEE